MSSNLPVVLFHGFGSSVPVCSHIESQFQHTTPVFVDSYPNISSEFFFQSHRGHHLRVLWGLLESCSFTSFSDLRKIVPYSQNSQDHIHSLLVCFEKSFLDISSSDLVQLIYMCQRTHLNTLPYSEIIFIIRRIFSFWRSWIAFSNVQFSFFSVPPHSFSDFIFLLALKYSAVPAYVFNPSSIPHLSFLLRWNDSHFHVSKPNSSIANIAFQSLQAFRDQQGLMQTYSSTSSLLSDLKKECLYQHLTSPLVSNSLVKRAKIYDSFTDYSPLDPSCSYSTFFLHYQPECSTCPVGQDFFDQRLAISQIRSTLPSNVTLLVKEHPFSFLTMGVDSNSPISYVQNIASIRSDQYYPYISSLQGVQLVDRRLSSSYLIANSESVYSISGTPVLQALLRAKKAIHLSPLSGWQSIIQWYQSHYTNIMLSDLQLNDFAFHCSQFFVYQPVIDKRSNLSNSQLQLTIIEMVSIFNKHSISP